MSKFTAARCLRVSHETSKYPVTTRPQAMQSNTLGELCAEVQQYFGASFDGVQDCFTAEQTTSSRNRVLRVHTSIIGLLVKHGQ